MPGLLVHPYQSFPAGGAAYTPAARTLSAHRYWRINISANSGGGFTSIAEVEMRTSIGGADVTGSGTASASASQGGAEVPSAAFDNNGSTQWAMAGSSGWLKYDFGSGQDKDIRQMLIRSGNNTGHEPTTFNLEWSDDDSVWTIGLVCTMSQTDWVGTNTDKFFTIPRVSYRCNITTTGSAGSAAIATLALAQTSGGADETQVANAGNALGTVSDLQAALRAFDANAATSWQSNTQPGTIAFHFGTSVNFKEAKITIETANSTVPKDFTFEVSVDGGQNWTNILSPAQQTGWVNNETRTFTY